MNRRHPLTRAAAPSVVLLLAACAGPPPATVAIAPPAPPITIAPLTIARTADGGHRLETSLTAAADAPVPTAAHWRHNGASSSNGAVALVLPAKLGRDVTVHEGENVYTLEVDLPNGEPLAVRHRVWGQQQIAVPPTIDGDLADWNDPPALWLWPSKYQVMPESRRLARDESSAMLYAVWHADNLFFAADVVDPTPREDGDGLLLMVRFPNGGGGVLTLLPGTESGPAGVLIKTTTESNGEPMPGAEAAAVATEAGWRLEARIPIAGTGHTPKVGDVVQMSVALGNSRLPGGDASEALLLWPEGAASNALPAVAGSAVILGDPASQPATPRRQLRGGAPDRRISPEATRDPAFLTPLPNEYTEHTAHLPEWLRLDLPWSGVYTISTGYGLESGSWTHQTIGNRNSANDFFCLDVDLPVGHPVLAMADGRIVTSVRRSDSYGNYIVIDHGQGYHSIYAHLDTRTHDVDKGEPAIFVRRGEVIGTAGSSGTSWPHLHFGLHHDARLSHSGANVGGIAVVPEPLGGYYGIAKGHVLEGPAGPAPP